MVHRNLIFLFLCSVLIIKSSDGSSRVKRAKYYSNPPQRFYRKPPPSYPVRGAFSYTPSPNYMEEDEPSKPLIIRKRQNPAPQPSSTGLADEDISNIVKYLSKEDLNKIIEYAGEKHRKPGRNINDDSSDGGGRYNHKPTIENYNRDQSNALYSDNRQTFQNNQFSPSNFDQTSKNNPMSFLNDFIQKDFNTPSSGLNTFSNNNEEERLPKPANLREDYDYESSNNVPRVVRAESYKVENFGDLPLMDYHSKLDKVSSYKVPHYSVISHKPYGPSIKAPQVEPAPPASVAQSQSEAHLKAVRIWTHHSTGAAYTLHSDGSLSPERPRNGYGYP